MRLRTVYIFCGVFAVISLAVYIRTGTLANLLVASLLLTIFGLALRDTWSKH